MSKNILVTGASGNLGKKILLALGDSSFLSPERADIASNLNFEIATNAAMDISLMKKVIKL
jgi:NAD(P)-dependent dehydrogenase (short-subunit alcohol dehydrogenase family)